MCRMLMRHLAVAQMLPPEQLPVRVPLVFFGRQMITHPCAMPGSFDHVKKVDNAGMTLIPCGIDGYGNQTVDPPALQAPPDAPLPSIAPAAAPGSAPGTGTGSGPALDSNAALLQGAVLAMHHVTQVHAESDMRNASVSQQQAKLQASTFQSQSQMLESLTRNLGNLGHDVGRATASQPSQHNHTLRAALSPPTATVGQSNVLEDVCIYNNGILEVPTSRSTTSSSNSSNNNTTTIST